MNLNFQISEIIFRLPSLHYKNYSSLVVIVDVIAYCILPLVGVLLDYKLSKYYNIYN